MSESAILEGLADSRLAVELDQAQRRTLASIMTLRDLRQGEVLVAEGSVDDHLYVVASGALGIVKAAGTVPYGKVVQAMDIARGSGVERIGIISEQMVEQAGGMVGGQP